jgi:hypothetical protein
MNIYNDYLQEIEERKGQGLNQNLLTVLNY